MFGVVDDVAGGPANWTVHIGRFTVYKGKEKFTIIYNADTVKIPLLTITKTNEPNEASLPPQDALTGVFFIKRSNVKTSPITDHEPDESSASGRIDQHEAQAWAEYHREGLKAAGETRLIVTTRVKENAKRSMPTFLATVYPYFSLKAGLIGGSTHTAPGVAYQLIDNFGANVSPAIITAKPAGTVVYDGMTGALGYGVVKSTDVIRLKNTPGNKDPLVFGTIVRAFSPTLKVNTPYYFTARMTLTFKDWLVVLGTYPKGLIKETKKQP